MEEFKLALYEIDFERLKQIRKVVMENGGYCPCVPKYAHTEGNKCFCEEFLNTGICRCGAFKSVEDSDIKD